MQLYGAPLCTPQNLKCEPKMQVWAMQVCPFLHSPLCSQSCAAWLKPVVTEQEPPFATLWQTAVPARVLPLISPQQLWPAGQSQE